MSHLNTIDIIRAWKDPEYRLGLSEGERALLPAHPAGHIELTDAELGQVVAGDYDGDPRDTPLDICDEVTPDPDCQISAGCDTHVGPNCGTFDLDCYP